MSKTNPISGKHVLVTRPVGQGARFAAALSALGAHPVLAPAIAIQPPDDRAAATQAVRCARRHAWIAFTSANGVHAFFDRLAEQREDARALGDAKVAAIGIRTAHALRERGVYADLVPQSFIAEDLARALIVASKPGDEILIYRAQEARDALPNLLHSAGRKPIVVAAYKTVVTEDPQFAAKVASCDILTFTSPSTVRGFVQNLGGRDAAVRASAAKIVACIGPVTAREAEDQGLTVAAIAGEYTADGLVHALEHLATSA